MAHPDTPASASRNSIISPFAGGMTTAQLEQVLQRTPQMTRFNPLRRHLRAPKAPESRISKSEIVAGDDEVATTSTSTPIVQLPESLTGKAIGDKGKEIFVAAGGDDVVQGVSKSTDLLRPSSHENVSRSKQRGRTLPKRFLGTIAKRKKLRREQRIASKLASSLPVEEPSNTSSQGEKGDEKTILFPHGSGRPSESNTLFTKPESRSDETSDGSQESISLEEIIRTASRTFNPQSLNGPEVQNISFSFRPPRLVRRAIMGSQKINNDIDDLDGLEIEILNMSGATHSSECMPGPNDSGDGPVDHASREGGPSPERRQKRKTKKRPRRLPVDELHLVSERVAEFIQEKHDENVQSSVEIPDDPISQDSSDAIKIIQTVGRTKSEKKVFQTYYGAFGKIDNKTFRFPNPSSTSPQAVSNNRHEVSPSHSDGFVGSEAKPTGRCMLVPKQKRVCVSIWGLTTRVAQLELVRERGYGPVHEPNDQAKRMVPAEIIKRLPKKKATLGVPVAIEAESQADGTGEIQQHDQDSQSHKDYDTNQGDQPMHGYLSGDEMIPGAENNSPPPPIGKVFRRVTFDERVGVDRRVRGSSLDSETFEGSFEVKRRNKSSDSSIWREMEMVRLKRCNNKDSEEDVLSANESERSVVSISSDDDEMEESDGSGDDSNEEMGHEEEDENENEHENEYEDEEYSNLQAVHERQLDEPIDGTVFSVEDKSSQESRQNSEKDDDRDDFYASKDMILNKQVSKEEKSTRVSVLRGSNQQKEISPFEDLILRESQWTETEGADNGQLSQLSIAMSWQNTTQAFTIPEADIWRPRRPKSSDVMNETQEDIFDSPSPMSTIAKRRPTGLQTRRRTAFRGRPIALTTGRPPTPPSPEIPETQVVAPKKPETRLIAVRDISPELGESQVSNISDELDKFIPDALPSSSTSYENSLHSSQLSFIPDDIPEETYFYRASQVLKEHKTSMSRSKSAPGRFHPDHPKSVVISTYVQLSTETMASEASAPSLSPKFSQQSYRPTPRSEKSLSRLTRQVSSASGTAPGSARKRMKALPFIPPFKKPVLKI